MSTRHELLVKAREAGRTGLACPVQRGDVSDAGLAVFQIWLLATTAEETGADLLPQYATSAHPDLMICRPDKSNDL